MHSSHSPSDVVGFLAGLKMAATIGSIASIYYYHTYRTN
jgi:hypothetical protein